MLSLMRRFLNTWIAKLFFIVMGVAFVYWGVNDMVRQVIAGGDIAKVAGQTITPQRFGREYARSLKRAQNQNNGAALSPEQRKAVGYQTLSQMIYGIVLDHEARREGLAVSDDALRKQIWAIKDFHGSNGVFDQNVFKSVLAENDLTEAAFIADMRKNLLESQLLDTLEFGATVPDQLTDRLFGFEAQTRTADVVLIKNADQPAPADPTDLQLQRFYANHLGLYATPEYRKVKLVVLSPETLASSQTVTDAEARAFYQANLKIYAQPEKRSVQVLVFTDQAKAQLAATAWSKNPDWTAIQQQAKDLGGSGVEIDDTTKADFPTPALADAAFAAPLDGQIGPVQAGLGWQLARVTAITPAKTVTYDQAAASIRAGLALQKAKAAVYDQANKLEDAIGQSSDLGQIPANIGATPVEGTLDAQGLGLDGNQAPLPVSGDARTAILADIFAATLNQPAEFKEVQGKGGVSSVFYALTVEQITPAGHKTYADAAAKVRADWVLNQRRHSAEVAAAKLLAAVQSGQALALGGTVISSGPIYRNSAPTDIPGQLVEPIFSLGNTGDTTMAETPDGFAVARLTKITAPDRAADPIDWDKLQAQLVQSVRNDIENTYTDSLRAAAKLSVNQKLLDATVQ